MPRELLLRAPREIILRSYKEPPLQPNEVRARAILSGISHGTELNLYRGTSPFHEKQFDPDLRLFVPSREEPTYPMRLGYEWVGRVVEVGDEVTNFRPGDLVHLPSPHQETHTFAEDYRTNLGPIEPLPPGLTPERAAFLALAGVALQAVHDAHIKVGDRVAIFGLGTIGLLAVQLARLNGATWVDAVDPIVKRRKLAEELGADRVLDPTVCDVGWEVKTAGPHKGADIAIEVSGHYAALHEAIRSVRMAGTVVAAGYYQGGASALRLGEEWHHNRITMISSMGVWDCPHRDYPLWDRGRVHATAAALLASGRLRVDGLITHRIPFEQAARAYKLIDQQPEEVVKVVLTYSEGVA
ncbi:MAG: zinc-binding dehydrogenase [Anaerolineae bacterium]|nr:zinc-binding dehydrogenase [Anaerolineae bacterium]